MTSNIPEEVTIPLGNLQRSALRSLMDRAAPDYRFDELLQLVFIKGMAALVKDRELPGISEEIIQEAQTDLPSGRKTLSKHPRVVADYLGFAIQADEVEALDELVAQHPFVDEDELCRIVFSAGLRALPQDDAAQRGLTAAIWTQADGSNR